MGGVGRRGVVLTSEDEGEGSEVFGETMSTTDSTGSRMNFSSKGLGSRDNNAGGNSRDEGDRSEALGKSLSAVNSDADVDLSSEVRSE